MTLWATAGADSAWPCADPFASDCGILVGARESTRRCGGLVRFLRLGIGPFTRHTDGAKCGLKARRDRIVICHVVLSAFSKVPTPLVPGRPGDEITSVRLVGDRRHCPAQLAGAPGKNRANAGSNSSRTRATPAT